ncbi:hypothetical protein DVH24_000706 [Malus domestica]|uniref:DUF7794 domain-containing protein n=1 Tax=Malus domestica TaxID=3750 RepID=A0A498K572_MALDO|nr:hypothetical protein DVH24_000706 [Malus domestica]
MDLLARTICFYILTIASFISSNAKADGTASVFFIDSSTHQFLRNPSSNDVVKPDSMLLSEVSAAVSVLLGFAPPSTLSAAGSAKLNEILVPNPFNRPRAVVALEVGGIGDHALVVKDNVMFSNAYSSKIDLRSSKADIELPDEGEVSVFSLDEQSTDYTDKDIGDFAAWMSGSYIVDTLEPLNGELSIPLANGDNLKLHMSKESDRIFTTSLLYLIRNFKRATEIHQDLSHNIHSPAELLTGRFDGIKVLQEQYGTDGAAQHGVELLLATLSKIFDSLENAYKGQIVGAILFNGVAPVESGKMLNVMYTCRSSARLLAEKEGLNNTKIVQVLLVRRTLAWITGIILIISTLLGVFRAHQTLTHSRTVDMNWVFTFMEKLIVRYRADGTASVFFIDSSTHHFLRNPSSNDVVKIFLRLSANTTCLLLSQPDSMLLSEVSAAVSVLLGFAPSSALSAAGSAKLNEVLMPNPFNRPRAVVALEVGGIDDHALVVKDNAMFSSAYSSKIDLGSSKADIELPDEGEVSVFSLDEQSTDYTDKEIGDFAAWMSGSYVVDTLEPLNGELSIPLANGDNLKLHMSKESDRIFTTSLLSLIRNFKRATEIHQDLSHNIHSPAELLTGRFDGIKVLQEQYGTDGAAQHGVELLLATLSKIFESLENAYKGQIVGAILFNGVAPVESGKMLNVMYTSSSYARLLAEKEGLNNTKIVQVLLVRRTLAWITGIILIISTLLGVCFLLNMPVTRDTLLYSNVKLD